MARRRRENNLSDTGTSSVANRLAAEQQRQQEARAARAEIIAETKAAQRKTAKFLETKPTDSRTIADTR